MKTRENKWMVKLDFIFSKLPFVGMYQKKSTHTFLGAWSFHLVHIWFTPNEGPKGFVHWFFEKLDHGSWTMEKCHLPWSDFMVYAVNWPSVWSLSTSLAPHMHLTTLPYGWTWPHHHVWLGRHPKVLPHKRYVGLLQLGKHHLTPTKWSSCSHWPSQSLNPFPRHTLSSWVANPSIPLHCILWVSNSVM